MASTILVQPNSYSADMYSESWFMKQPIDLRYTSSRYHSFTPISSMKNTRTITFSLPAFSNSTIWDLGNSYIELSLKIVDEQGNPPDAETYIIGFVNNVLKSLFEDIKLYLNGNCLVLLIIIFAWISTFSSLFG